MGASYAFITYTKRFGCAIQTISWQFLGDIPANILFYPMGHLAA